MYILWTNYMMIDHTGRHWLRVTRSSASLTQSDALERVTLIRMLFSFSYIKAISKKIIIMEIDPFHF